MANVQNTPQYNGTERLAMLAGWQPGLTADDRWEITAAALRAAGCPDPRPAPQGRAAQ